MLSIGLISLLVAIPVLSYRITPNLFNRITSVILIYSALLAFNGIHFESLASGVGIYSGLFHISTITLAIETFILIIGSILLLSWASTNNNNNNYNNNNNIITTSNIIIINTIVPTISEYSLIILFTTIGATLLLSSSDLISIYLSIELQSFAVYILATLYRDSESSTSAGLKYFLLGGLSSCLILLGTAIIYSSTGLTQFENIYTLVQVTENNFINNYSITCGLLLIGIGFLFKIAAAPLHNWAPDVYDGVPTIVTSWLTTIPKISILIFILELQSGLQGSFESINVIMFNESISINIWKNLLLISSILSLIIGTIVGLSQYRIKRLLAYSTISHVGFILLALSINTEESIESYVFYLMQYSVTNLNTFLILLGFSYIIKNNFNNNNNNNNNNNSCDIVFIDELKGQFKYNPLLGFSLCLCLFSIAGIPPLIGFFAKQMVLYSSVHGGYYFISIIAILVSVISASYYLKIIRVIYFDTEDNNNNNNNYNNNNNNIINKESESNIFYISNMHSLIISILTIIIILFIINPSILLNSCNILALSLFNY